MSVKFTPVKSLLILLIFLPLCLFSLPVTGEVSPSIDYFTQIKNLPKEKFATKEWALIEQALAKKNQFIRFVSYNLLHNAYNPSLPDEHQFAQRLPRIVKLIELMKPDIMGIQELFIDEVGQLRSLLSKEFHFFGKGQMDGEVYGEVNGIFYKHARFKKIDSFFFFINENPVVKPNLPPGSIKGVNALLLEDKPSGKKFIVFNAHITFKNPDRRLLAFETIQKIIQERFPKLPVVFMGDCNTFPKWPDQLTLPFYDGPFAVKPLKSIGLQDAYEESLVGHIGPLGSFTNKDENVKKPFTGTGTPGIFLDRMFFNQNFQVIIHAVEKAQVEGHYPSDHMPIIVEAFLKTDSFL